VAVEELYRFLPDSIDCIRPNCDSPRTGGIILLKAVRYEIGASVVLVPGKQIELMVRDPFGRP